MAKLLNTGRIGALAGVIAAASMAATPAYAAEMLPANDAGNGSAYLVDFDAGGAFDSGIYTAEADTAEWRGRGYRRYRRNRIDGGDVLAGVLILGGIAAIASAASNNERRERVERRRDYEERRYDDRRYDDRRQTPRSSNDSGLDSAVSQCLAEIERDVRVDTVDGASRVASGWIVSGTLFNGSGFSCQIGNNGQITGIDYGGLSGVSYDGEAGETAPGQWSDARYANARADVGQQSPDMTSLAYSEDVYDDQQPRVQTASDDSPSEPQPRYPGGPLPGEEGY